MQEATENPGLVAATVDPFTLGVGFRGLHSELFQAERLQSDLNALCASLTLGDLRGVRRVLKVF